MAGLTSTGNLSSRPDETFHRDSQTPAEVIKREVFQRTLILATAAHELKTPLAAIAGYTDFLLGSHAGPLTEKQKDILTEMQQNALRLQLFIQSLLSFSALESGRVQVQKEPGNLGQCVSDVLDAWAAQYAARGTTWEFRPDPTVESVCFDNLKVQHIISNLLDNALKFTPPGSHVTVTIQRYLWERRRCGHGLPYPKDRRNPNEPQKHNCVRIDVSDNGPGIPAEYHQEIFEEFLQVKENPYGIGLGLAIARELAEAHGGKYGWKVTKERVPLFLCCCQPYNQGDNQMNACSDFPGRPSILVVDDEPSMLIYTRTLLGGEKYSVETASSGEEAIRRIQGRPADLMLLDMCMPEMNGLQTIEACRKVAPDQRIVMMSCVNDTNTVVQAIRMGALDYLTKPIYKAELDAVITRCLSPKPEYDIPVIHFTASTEQEHIDDLENDHFFLAASPAMKQIRAQISIIAKVDVPILLLGESGVGKEILARLIHRLSSRHTSPFLR